MPLSLGRLKMTHLQLVLDQASNKLSGWQGKLFNIGGRKELVRSVLNSIPTYLMTDVKAPKSFYKAMDKIRRRFQWAGTQQIHGGKYKVSWDKVCRPLHCGGLGITDLEAFRRALRLRWLWFQWINPDKPWCNTELPIDSIDEALFAAATRVMVHDGCTTQFWTSSRLSGKSHASMFPSLYKHSKRKNRIVVNALQNENWITDIMHTMTAPLLVEFMLL
jgi:hypothetical protein